MLLLFLLFLTCIPNLINTIYCTVIFLDVPNPDGLNSEDPSLDFTYLGPRVPAILISPWIPKGIGKPVTIPIQLTTSVTMCFVVLQRKHKSNKTNF